MQSMSAKVIFNKLESAIKVEYRILYKTLITVHKCLFGMALDYLKKKFNFTQCRERYALRSTKEMDMLEVPKAKFISYRDRTFSTYGAHQWNILPRELRCEEEIATFKKSLITLLFK